MRFKKKKSIRTGQSGTRVTRLNTKSFVPFATAEQKPPFETGQESFCRVNSKADFEFPSVSHFLPDWQTLTDAVNTCVRAVLEDLDRLYPKDGDVGSLIDPSGCWWDLDIQDNGNNLAVASLFPLVPSGHPRLREYVEREVRTVLGVGLKRLLR